MYIVDTNIVMSWFMSDEERSLTERFQFEAMKGNVSAPRILLTEMTHALRKAVLNERLQFDDVVEILKVLDALNFRFAEYDTSRQLALVVQRALEFQISSYDSHFLSLAIDRDCPLVTLDAKLRKAAEQAGVVVLPQI